MSDGGGYLATLKRKGDWYLDANGCTHETWADALGELLDFCGCGCPEDALGYVLRILRAVNLPRPETYDAHHTWYNTVYKPALDVIFHGDSGAEYFAFYWLDDKKLTEHGGSVPGWLSDHGRAVLLDLEAHAAEILSPAPPHTNPAATQADSVRAAQSSRLIE